MIPSDRSKTILAQHVSWPVDRSGRGEKVNPDFQKNLVVCTVATTNGRAIGLIIMKFVYKNFKI